MVKRMKYIEQSGTLVFVSRNIVLIHMEEQDFPGSKLCDQKRNMCTLCFLSGSSFFLTDEKLPTNHCVS